jgi:probable nitrogen fixation protein
MTFMSDLLDQIRAGDHFGRLDRIADEKLLKPFVVEREKSVDLSDFCDIDAATENRLRTFYQAIAVGIEKTTGVMTTSMIDINHEGFGRAVVFAGRLVLVSTVMREAGKFGFASIDKLEDAGERFVEQGAKAFANYPQVAQDDN